MKPTLAERTEKVLKDHAKWPAPTIQHEMIAIIREQKAELERALLLLRECEPNLYHPHEPEIIKGLEKRINDMMGR